MSKPPGTPLLTVVGRLRRAILHRCFGFLYRFGGRGYDLLVRLLFGTTWDEFRAAALDLVHQDPVLDLGCGTGRLLMMLADRGIPAVGVEREPSMLGAARRNGARGLLRADTRALPVQSGVIGACVATFPAPDIAERATLTEIARVLRPGGRFIVVLGGLPRRNACLPLRLALRLAYGDRSVPELPSADLLLHEALPGTWQRVNTASGAAVFWIAERSRSD